MKIGILLFSCLVFLDFTRAMNEKENPGKTGSPIAGPARASPPRESTPRASRPRASRPRASTPRESLPRASPQIATPAQELSPRESVARAVSSRASLPREGLLKPQALPIYFPPNTRVFVQNKDGQVFSGPLTYMSGRSIPRWVFYYNSLTAGAESVFVRMPNGDGLMSNIQELRHTTDVSGEMLAQPRCFILYGNGNILEAVLQRYSELPRERANVPRGFIRMPVEYHRFLGDFQQFCGIRPSWLE